MAEATVILDELISFGIKLGLDNIRLLLRELGNPEQVLNPIHVAGTNGKGSVCSLLAAALRAAGLRTGLFTSPHLLTVRERLRVDGEAISESDFAAIACSIREQADAMFNPDAGSSPTFFEFVAALGFEYFRQQQVDVAIIEVGMGGRLDATNVIRPLLTVITSIDFDHTKALGGTLAKIAAEKAGIITPGVPIVCGETKTEAVDRIAEIAAERGAPLYRLGHEFEALGHHLEAGPEGARQHNHVRFAGREVCIPTRLVGPHQLVNAAVAYATLSLFAEQIRPLPMDRAQEGMGAALWPARLQRLPGGLMVDAAHNLSAARMLRRSLSELYPERRWHILFGVLDDKAWPEMLEELQPLCRALDVVTVDHHRAVPAAQIEAYVREKWPDLSVNICAETGAWGESHQGEEDALVVGSIYLAAEVIGVLLGGDPVPVQAS